MPQLACTQILYLVKGNKFTDAQSNRPEQNSLPFLLIQKTE